MSKGSRGGWQRNAMSGGRHVVVDKQRLAALEHNSANARTFEEVIRQGFRWGFVVGLTTAAVVSNVTWLAFRYL